MTPGPDVARIDRALGAVFDRCDVDPKRVAVSGFSDGASYALTLGLANGDFFGKVVAFSPCVVSKGIELHGRPSFFLTHGTADEILPINNCGRVLSKALQRSGYEVRYEEFEGRHEIPPGLAKTAFLWMAAP